MGLNNLDAACASLDEYQTTVEKHMAKSGILEPSEAITRLVSRAIGELRAATDVVIEKILERMRSALARLIYADATGGDAKPRRALKQKLFEKAKRLRRQLQQDSGSPAQTPRTPDEPVGQDPLFDYLNHFLEFIAAKTYLSTFKRFLRELWKSSVAEMMRFTLGRHNEGLSIDVHSDLLFTARSLATFFEADGDGLRHSITEPDVKLLQTTLGLCTLDTRDINAVAVQSHEDVVRAAVAFLLHARTSEHTTVMSQMKAQVKHALRSSAGKH